MSDTAALLLCLAFVVVRLCNSRRARHWTEVPEVLEVREHLIPLQIPGVIFFGAFPFAIVLDAILGHPAGGSTGGIVVGMVGGVLALAGLVLAIGAYWFGRPRRIIAPIGRDGARWAPRHQAQR
jgi:hypothetical protein